jgi:hypothetical protein
MSIPITDPVAQRVAMINGDFDLPPATLAAMGEIRAVMQVCARRVQSIVEAQPKHDKGRLIASIDQLQHTKNTLCDALILPHASTRSE